MMPGVVDVISDRDVPAANELYYIGSPEIIFAKEKVNHAWWLVTVFFNVYIYFVSLNGNLLHYTSYVYMIYDSELNMKMSSDVNVS